MQVNLYDTFCFHVSQHSSDDCNMIIVAGAHSQVTVREDNTASKIIIIMSRGVLRHHRQWRMGVIGPNFDIIGCCLGPIAMISWGYSNVILEL